MKIDIVYWFIILFTFTSCRKDRYENKEDIYRIKKGMKFRDVQFIMRNKPFKYRNLTDNDSLFFSYYKSPFASSGDFLIEFNKKKDSIVVDVWYGD